MTGLFIVFCIIWGVIDGLARLGAMNVCTRSSAKDNVSMGHHYQRDVVFHDMMGL